MNVTAIVLAGGASARFGMDKLAVIVEGRPLLEHALLAVAAVADSVVLVLAPDGGVPQGLGDLGVPVVIARDRASRGGPLAGLAEGIAALDARGRAGIAVVVGGDMPSLEPPVLRLLVGALRAGDHSAVMTLATSGAPPLPMAIRPDAVAPVIETILGGSGRRSLRALVETVPSGSVPEHDWRALDPDGRTLRDIDRPEDLRTGI